MQADAAGPDPELIPPARLAFQASTWYLLALAGARARHLWAEILAQRQLSPSQHKVLQALNDSGPLGQHQLAALIAIDPRNVVPLVDGLAERELLARTVDPADRRRRVLTLTARGRRVAREMASVATEIETDFLSPLTSTEQGALRRMLLSLLRADGQSAADG
jgi:DNA-binding MarR family transcriptional regulator